MKYLLQPLRLFIPIGESTPFCYSSGLLFYILDGLNDSPFDNPIFQGNA